MIALSDVHDLTRVMFFWPRLSYAVLSSVTAPEIQMGYRWVHKWQIADRSIAFSDYKPLIKIGERKTRALKCKVFKWEQASLHCTCLIIFEIFRITIHNSFPPQTKPKIYTIYDPVLPPAT